MTASGDDEHSGADQLIANMCSGLAYQEPAVIRRPRPGCRYGHRRSAATPQWSRTHDLCADRFRWLRMQPAETRAHHPHAAGSGRSGEDLWRAASVKASTNSEPAPCRSRPVAEPNRNEVVARTINPDGCSQTRTTNQLGERRPLCLASPPPRFTSTPLASTTASRLK